jgi:lysozyme family protein
MQHRDYKKIIDHTQKWEGGLSRDKNDSASVNPNPLPYKGVTGWHTNKGITYATWVSLFGKDSNAEFYEMKDEQWIKAYFVYYNAVKGNQILNDSIAYFLTQIAWGSGIGGKQAGKTVQKALNQLGHNLTVDGIIGIKTLEAINTTDSKTLFDKMIEFRVKYFQSISKGRNQTFLKGWLRRLEDFRLTFRPTK